MMKKNKTNKVKKKNRTNKAQKKNRTNKVQKTKNRKCTVHSSFLLYFEFLTRANE